MNELPIDVEALYDFALRLVRTPSPSGSEGAVARMVAEEMERLGLKVQVVPSIHIATRSIVTRQRSYSP